MSEIAKYEKMLKDNNAAVKRLVERGKQIQAVIKLLKSLQEVPEDSITTAYTLQGGRVEGPEPLDEETI